MNTHNDPTKFHFGWIKGTLIYLAAMLLAILLFLYGGMMVNKSFSRHLPLCLLVALTFIIRRLAWSGILYFSTATGIIGLVWVGLFGFLGNGFGDPETYYGSGILTAISWILGTVGILFGYSAAKKWTSPRSRRVSVWIAISIPLLFHVSTLIIDSDMVHVWQSSG